MNKALIKRLVTERSKLPLSWGVPIEDEAQWWAETLAEELWATGAQWSANWIRTGDGENKK